jgi:hypothetical protein
VGNWSEIWELGEDTQVDEKEGCQALDLIGVKYSYSGFHGAQALNHNEFNGQPSVHPGSLIRKASGPGISSGSGCH